MQITLDYYPFAGNFQHFGKNLLYFIWCNLAFFCETDSLFLTASSCSTRLELEQESNWLLHPEPDERSSDFKNHIKKPCGCTSFEYTHLLAKK